MARQGLNQREIGEAVGMTKQGVGKALKRLGQPVAAVSERPPPPSREEQLAALRAMVAAGR